MVKVDHVTTEATTYFLRYLLNLWFVVVNSIDVGAKASKKASLQQSSGKWHWVKIKDTNATFQFQDEEIKVDKENKE